MDKKENDHLEIIEKLEAIAIGFGLIAVMVLGGYLFVKYGVPTIHWLLSKL